MICRWWRCRQVAGKCSTIVGGGTQEPAQLVDEKAAATGTVDFQAMMQLLDPILDVAAGTVDRFVQMPGRVFEVVARLASVIDAADQRLGPPKPSIARLQQHGAAVRTGVFLVKFDRDRLGRQI